MKCVWKNLISILISNHHLLNDLLKICISYLDNTIHLGSVRKRIILFNLPLCAKFSNQLPIKIQSIVSYQLCLQSVTMNQILLNELLGHFLYHMFIRAGFYPISEVVDYHQDEFISIVGLWIDQTYNI